MRFDPSALAGFLLYQTLLLNATKKIENQKFPNFLVVVQREVFFKKFGKRGV